VSALLVADAVSVEIDGATLLPTTSLAVGAGERVAVLGENGAGKTTLLRVLGGRLRPSAGDARLDGASADERRPEVRRAIAALIEPPVLYPDLVLEEQLALVETAWAGTSAPAPAGGGARTAAGFPGFGAAALDRFGIGHLADRFPHELSSGQHQLACLSVTFARPARALLLDEPEQRLDPSRREILAGAIVAASEAGAAVVFASHSVTLVEAAAQRSIRVGA